MEALRLRKKFPEVSQDEMFDLITRFKYVDTYSDGISGSGFDRTPARLPQTRLVV